MFNSYWNPNTTMDLWLIDGLECDPLEWWEELRAFWNSAEVKACLKSKGFSEDTANTSEVHEEYSLVDELGLGPNSWMVCR